jgi:hypothetical protein
MNSGSTGQGQEHQEGQEGQKDSPSLKIYIESQESCPNHGSDAGHTTCNIMCGCWYDEGTCDLTNGKHFQFVHPCPEGLLHVVNYNVESGCLDELCDQIQELILKQVGDSFDTPITLCVDISAHYNEGTLDTLCSAKTLQKTYETHLLELHTIDLEDEVGNFVDGKGCGWI